MHCLGFFFLTQASTRAHIRSGKFSFNTQNGSGSARPRQPQPRWEPYLALGIPLHLVPAPAPSLCPFQASASSTQGIAGKNAFIPWASPPARRGLSPSSDAARVPCVLPAVRGCSAHTPPQGPGWLQPCLAPLLPLPQPHAPLGLVCASPAMCWLGLSCAGAAGEMSVGNFPLLSSSRSPFVCVSGSGAPIPACSRYQPARLGWKVQDVAPRSGAGARQCTALLSTA